MSPERRSASPDVRARATVSAPANIAFVKYWGARDVERALPFRPSISMTLSRCVSVCTVEVLGGGEGTPDEVRLLDTTGRPGPASEAFAAPVRAHAERIRRRVGRTEPLRVTTRNSFPGSAGLASSASGFAALTLAALRAFGVELAPEDASDLARLSGSGSAARSVLGGYVEWPAVPAAGTWAPAAGTEPASTAPVAGGDPGADRVRGERVAARCLAPASHWDLRDVVAVVDAGPKPVSSREGHRRVLTSPYFRTHLDLVPGRLARVREAIEARDVSLLGSVLEVEGLDLHLLAMTSVPPIHYWAPGTLEVLGAVRALRDEGVACYWTMDAGPNVHVVCEPEFEDAVAARLSRLPSVEEVIRDRVGSGPRVESEHLA